MAAEGPESGYICLSEPQFLHLQNGKKIEDQISEEAESLGWVILGAVTKKDTILSYPPPSTHSFGGTAPSVECGEGPLGKPQCSRKPVPSLRPPRPTPNFSGPSDKGRGKERGNLKFRGTERGREREGGEEKAEQRGGSWPAGERKKWTAPD